MLTHDRVYIVGVGVGGFCPCHKNYIAAGSGNELWFASGKSCPYYSFRTVSVHCIAYLFTGSYSYTTNSRTVSVYISNQCRMFVRFSAPVGAAKITIRV